MKLEPHFYRGLVIAFLLVSRASGIRLEPLHSMGFGYLSDAPYSIALSPDGRKIAIACRMGVVLAGRSSHDGTVRFEKLLEIGIDGNTASSGIAVVDFVEPDFVVGGGFDGKVWLWNVEQPNSPVLIYSPPVPDRIILLTATDKNTLAAVYADGQVKILKGVTPFQIKKAYSLKLTSGDSSWVTSASYNQTLKQLAVVTSGARAINIFKYEKNGFQFVRSFDPGVKSDYPMILRYSPNGRYLACVCQNRAIVIDASSLKTRKEFFSTYQIFDVTFSDDGSVLFAASGLSPRIEIFRVENNPFVNNHVSVPVKILNSRINFMLFLPSLNTSSFGEIAIASLYPGVIGFDPLNRKTAWKLMGFINGGSRKYPGLITYSNGGLVLVSEYSFLTIDSSGQRFSYSPHNFDMKFVSLDGVGADQAVALNLDGTLVFLKGSDMVTTVNTGRGNYHTFCMSVTRKFVFVGGDSGHIFVYNVITRKTGMFRIPDSSSITAIEAQELSDSKIIVFAGTRDGSLYYFYAPEAVQRVGEVFSGMGISITDIAYSTKTALLAVGFDNGTVIFYRARSSSWQLVDKYQQSSPVLKVEVLPDGQRYVVAHRSGLDVTVVKKRRVVTLYRLRKNGVGDIAISPDGSKLAIFRIWGRVEEYRIIYDSAPPQNEFQPAAGPVVQAGATEQVPQQLVVEKTAQEPTPTKTQPSAQPVADVNPVASSAAPPPSDTPPAFTAQSVPSDGASPIGIVSPMPSEDIIKLDFRHGNIVEFYGRINGRTLPPAVSYAVTPIVGQNFSYLPQANVGSDGAFKLALQFPTPGIYSLELNATVDGNAFRKRYILLVGSVKNVYLLVYGLNAPRYPDFPVFNYFETSAMKFYRDIRYGLELAQENTAYFIGINAIPGRFMEKLRQFENMAGDTGVVIVGIFAPALIDPQNPYAFYIPGYNSRPDNLTTSSIASYVLESNLRLSRSRKLIFIDAVKGQMLDWELKSGLVPAGSYSGLGDMVTSLNDAILKLGESNSYTCVISSSQMQSESYSMSDNAPSSYGGPYSLFLEVIDSGLRGAADRDGDGIVYFHELKRHIEEQMPSTALSAQPGFAGACSFDVPLSVLSLIRRR